MPTITSGSITLLDVTDSKKIDLHISSNHPTIQIYDQNASQEQLTPDWSINPLELTPIVYVDSTDVTDSLSNKFTWTKIKGSDTTEEVVSTSKVLIVSTNDLNESANIRYKCTVEYNGKSFSNEITFARVYTGKDGASGSNAPAVKAQYSVDGTNDWSATLNPSTHKYIRFSYDNGATWTSAIKIYGEDGKSVQIKGVAYAKAELVVGQAIVLYSDVNTSVQITNAITGDSYLVDGYLCVYNGTNFVCTGQIQGPQGDKGDSYYLFIRYADNSNGNGISTTPDGKSYIGFYRSSVNQVPTDVSSATWNWAKFVGEDAKNIVLTGNAQAFKVDKSNTVSPTTIKVTAQTENTSVTSWTYSIDGGTTFTSSAAGVSRSGNVVTITGSAMTANSIVVKATDGVHSDVFTVYKVSDGSDGDEGEPAPVVFLTNENISFAANANGQIAGTTIYCNVVAYRGTTKVTPTIGTILSAEIPTGMTIGTTTITSNEIVIPITIANNATLGSAQSVNGTINIPITSPVATSLKLTWSKINSGVKGDIGIGISSVTVTYGTSTSASTYPTSWQSSIPVVAEGSYLWTRTVTDYTDSSIVDTVTYTYAKQGAKGDTGSPGSPVTVSKIEYQAGTSATTAPTGTWSSGVVSVAEGNYLWTKTTFSDNKVAYGVAKQGAKGDKGDAGTNASLVDITPSALYFKSTTGKDGTFTPDYIYLYPRFQTVTFGKWEYSINGGTTWVAASGANGLTISTYNSVANTLRIAKTSTLYTDTVTSISFRCVSSNASVYDTVSIGKLFDVDVEEINTRITNSLAEVKTTTDSISSRVSATETSIGTINNNISSITNRVSTAEQKITPTAIVSTVRQSTDYTNDLGKKVNSSEIISKINQTAESITISANKIGLLGATNIPDLTADKIKGGTLTLGGSSATTQNGQLLVKNASNVDMLKVNKDGLVVKSGHLAVAEDFQNSTYNWDTGVWTTTTNTSQLDLQDRLVQMGVYSSSGYSNSMRLTDTNLRFQGIAQGVGSWGSFVGHDNLGNFVVQDSERSNISFRGYGNTEMASISTNGLYLPSPLYGGVTSGNARLFTNVFVKNFTSQPTGYICVKLGSATLAQGSMITVKGHITSYQNSTSFEASCYFYSSTGTFYGGVATMTNPDVLKEVYFAERNGYAYLILGASNAVWSYPTVAIDSLSVGYAGNTASEWTYGWDAVVYSNITSNFTKIAACTRGGINVTLWTGAILSGATITVSENIRNFKFLTCVMGDASISWGITMGAFMDSDISELHFGAIYTDANSIAGANLYGVRFNINSPTSLTMQACGTKSGGGAYMRKIVGWR